MRTESNLEERRSSKEQSAKELERDRCNAEYQMTGFLFLFSFPRCFFSIRAISPLRIERKRWGSRMEKNIRLFKGKKKGFSQILL